MPVVTGLEIEIEMADVLRREGGTRSKKMHPRILAMTVELLSEVESDKLLQPAVVYDFFPVREWGKQHIALTNGSELEGRILVSKLAGAQQIVGVMCTIGPSLDNRVAEYHDQNDDLRSMLLDGIGNAAMDALSREVCHRIGDEALTKGSQASGALGPGLHGLPMSNQEILYALIDGGKIGIELTSGAMMLPNKSISMIIGVGEELEGWERAEACDWCHIKSNCAYRLEKPATQSPKSA